jgi:hypothetical protein
MTTPAEAIDELGKAIAARTFPNRQSDARRATAIVSYF